jgi:predicted phosphodiesterase
VTLVLLSDIHANIEAFNSVLNDLEKRVSDDYKICILGDVINYGVNPNETINTIKNLNKNGKVELILMGNHEKALFGEEDDRFSSKRGKDALDITKSILTKENLDYIKNYFSSTKVVKILNGKKCLFVHGSFEDNFWKSIDICDLNLNNYKEFDFVFSGHSHKPYFYEKYFDIENSIMKNKKKIIFINPGSIGQPRNHNPMAQYLTINLEKEEISFCKVSYNIKKTQDKYNKYDIDSFYKDRLKFGL